MAFNSLLRLIFSETSTFYLNIQFLIKDLKVIHQVFELIVVTELQYKFEKFNTNVTRNLNNFSHPYTMGTKADHIPTNCPLMTVLLTTGNRKLTR